jgi:hypothetical protein
LVHRTRKTPNLKGHVGPGHFLHVKAFLVLSLIAAACGSADQPDDRAAIARTIASLNRIPRPAGLFTADSRALPVLEGLWKGKWPRYRVHRDPAVTISHEPWGEAAISFPVEVENPRIVCGAVRLISSDEALAAATMVYWHSGLPPRLGEVGGVPPHIQTTELTFLMKKDGADWKIESVGVNQPALPSDHR